MLTLNSWSNVWIEFEVDPRSGRWSKRKLAQPRDVGSSTGFARLEPVWGLWKRFYAIYVCDKRLIFQAGRNRWDVTDGVRHCRFWAALYGLLSGLNVHFVNGERHHAVLIHPWRGVWAHIDPTYDGMDFDNDHFFYYLRQYMPDEKWRSAFIERASGLRETAV